MSLAIATTCTVYASKEQNISRFATVCPVYGTVADFRFADWDTKEMCGFTIDGLLLITTLRICDLRAGIPRQLAALRITHYKFAD